jgi:hypothetical protein
MLMPAISHIPKKIKIVLAGRHPGIDYLNYYVNQCIDIESSGWHRLFMERPGDYFRFPYPRPDRLIAFINDPEGKITENIINCFPSSSVHVFPVFPPEEKKVHMALYMARSLEKAGLPIDAKQSFEDASKAPLISGLAPRKKKEQIVLHPGSGSKDKNYPPDFWLELVKGFKKKNRAGAEKIVLLLGPAEEGLRPYFNDNLKKTKVRMFFSPEKEDLLKLLGSASLYLGHDSGITHLAAMMGVPIIALFRRSSPEQWAPLGPAVKIIRDEKGSLDLLEDVF